MTDLVSIYEAHLLGLHSFIFKAHLVCMHSFIFMIRPTLFVCIPSSLRPTLFAGHVDELGGGDGGLLDSELVQVDRYRING